MGRRPRETGVEQRRQGCGADPGEDEHHRRRPGKLPGNERGAHVGDDAQGRKHRQETVPDPVTAQTPTQPSDHPFG